MRVLMPMRECLANKRIFGSIIPGPSWFPWRVILIAAAGEALTDEERQEFQRLTGREREPGFLCKELIACVGRRGGKTQAAICFSIWLSVFVDHRDALQPGETGVLLIISQTLAWSKEILNRLEGILLHGGDASPFPSLITRRTQDALELSNGISIVVRPASYRTLRGPTFIGIIADEVAFWFTDTNFANPDVEILRAVRPGTLTTGGPLLMMSSVYARVGELYENWKRYYGSKGPDDIIVAYGSTRDFHPSIPQSEIDRELERDPIANRAEYLSEWRDDTAGFVQRPVVERNTGDYLELAPQPNINYVAFIDPATGVEGGDSLALAIAHKDSTTNKVVVDVVREWRPPFNFFDVVNNELAPLLKAYRIHQVFGDNYGGELAKLPIRSVGIGYELSKKHKSALYLDPFLGLLNSNMLLLPRHDRLIAQICSLERSVQRSGREEITHPTHGHDDAANACAGSVDVAYAHASYDRGYSAWADPPLPQNINAADRNLVNYYRSIEMLGRWGGF
jgi:hypothetical protein